MGKREFDDFLNKEEQKVKPKVDWEYEKKKWLDFISNLYIDVQAWLSEYVETQKLNLDFNDIEIYEEALGRYTVKELKIIIW